MALLREFADHFKRTITTSRRYLVIIRFYLLDTINTNKERMRRQLLHFDVHVWENIATNVWVSLMSSAGAIVWGTMVPLTPGCLGEYCLR